MIEHNQAVMAHADWIIDLDHDGGRIVFDRHPPADLVASKSTLTETLADTVSRRPFWTGSTPEYEDPR